jgi:RNA polymerase sigma-70 factor (ECF subfamily)
VAWFLVREHAMSDDHLDRLIERLNDGDLSAAEHAFLAYEPYLRMAVRRQLGGRLRAKLDSMDIVQSVWADVLCGLHETNWQFADRAHLRAFLVRLVNNRLIDRHRQHRRALERERSLNETAVRSLPTASDPRPSEVVQVGELWDQILAACPPAHHEIVRLRRQGLALTEIAARTGLHEGSVRRILYELSRRLALPRRTTRTASPEPDGAGD